MAVPSLSPLEVKDYTWRQAPEPGLWERRACGIENLDGLEIPNKKGHNDFYVSVTTQFHQKELTLSQIIRSFKKIWCQTRFQYPQVACAPVWRDGQLYLTHRAPADKEEAMKWVDRTVSVELSQRSAADVELDIEQKRRDSGNAAQPAGAITIHVLAHLPTINDYVANAKVVFLFHMNHIFFDGTGAYTLIGIVLEDLAADLSVTSEEMEVPEYLPLVKSIENLTPAFIEILNPEQSLSGPMYDAALAKALTETIASQASWGLKTNGSGDGIARNDFYTLSAMETQNIRVAAKKAGFNITHLAHAATFLVMLKLNPPTKSETASGNIDPFIGSYFALNDRRWIDKKFLDPRGRYLANCHGHGNIQVNDIRRFCLTADSTEEEICRCLATLAATIKSCYDEYIHRPCRVSAGLAFMEMLAGIVAS